MASNQDGSELCSFLQTFHEHRKCETQAVGKESARNNILSTFSTEALPHETSGVHEDT